MIPDFQSLMLPFLQIASDEREHSTNEAIDTLAKQFKLSEEELNEWTPSKRQKTFYNRVHWAKAYLKMAGAIDNISRGLFTITKNGKDILKDNPTAISVKYLTERFPQIKNHFSSQKESNHETNGSSIKVVDTSSNETPEEQIENSYQNIRQLLEQEILSKLKSVHPSFFERIVVELLVKMGYGGSIQDAGKAIGKSGDEGIDGIIKEDRLGLDVIYIQAKRWDGVVGRPEIQKFVGALAGQRAKKGVFITTSNFTKEAISYALQMDTKIVLIDGAELASLMIDFNLGVSTQNTYEIKRIDSDYFEEE